MIIGAANVDMGDSVANFIAVLALIVSIMTWFAADSRAKDANKTAREALKIARQANDISGNALSVTERSELREMKLALHGPMDTARIRLKELADETAGLDFDGSIDACDEIVQNLNLVGGIVAHHSRFSDYVSRASVLTETFRMVYSCLKYDVPLIPDRDDRDTFKGLDAVHRNLRQAARMTQFYLVQILTKLPDDPYWDGCIDSTDKYEKRLRASSAELVAHVKGEDPAETYEYMWL